MTEKVKPKTLSPAAALARAWVVEKKKPEQSP